MKYIVDIDSLCKCLDHIGAYNIIVSGKEGRYVNIEQVKLFIKEFCTDVYDEVSVDNNTVKEIINMVKSGKLPPLGRGDFGLQDLETVLKTKPKMGTVGSG